MNIDPVIKNDIIARWLNHQSVRSIANDTQIGRKIIARVIRQHTAQTQSTDSNSAPACFGPAPLSRKSKLGPFLGSLKQLLSRYPNITAQRVFEELCKLGFQGSYSTLRTFMKGYRSKPKAPVIRFETLPGAQAQMDWSTYTIDFTQEGSRRVQLFSYILGYSRRQYIGFTERQDFETTVRQHVAAFEHLGGAAATCLYDNMKVVVTRWEDGGPIYNPRFLSFATHYGFKPWACQPRHPETKGKVERPFDYADNRYSIPWRLIGQLIPVRILEDHLEIFNGTIDRVATHPLVLGRNQKQCQDSHRPPKDHDEQLAILREKYTHLGPVALEYFEGILRKCRNSRHESQRILALLYGYTKRDGLAAMQRGIQYHAYGYQSLERILAHIGTPKPNWELLSQREQEALQRITESTRVEARSSKEYQQLFEQEKPNPNHDEAPQIEPDCEADCEPDNKPSGDDSALPGSSENEAEGGTTG